MNKERLNRLLPGHLRISLSLLGLSILMAILFPSAHRTLMIFGMLFSMLGDMALMNWNGVFSKYTPSPFVTGGLLFMTGHVFYGLAYQMPIRQAGRSPFGFGMAAAILLGILTVLSLLLMAKRNGCFSLKKGLLLALYASFEFFDCCMVFACAQAAFAPCRLCGILGILLFIASDYFIGMDKVANDRSLTKYIWTFYTAGQLLLILG